MTRQVVILVVVAGVVSSGPVSSQSPIRIAVLDFTGEGPTELFATYSRTISDNLVLSLARSRGIHVVERSGIAQALAELELSASGAVDTQTAIQLGRMLGATHIIMGSYGVVADEILITTRYIAVATADIAGGRRIIGPELLPIVDHLAEQVTLDLTPLDSERQEILQRRRDREAMARSLMKRPGMAALAGFALPILGHGYLGRSSNLIRGILYTIGGTGLVVLGVAADLGDDGLYPFLAGVGLHTAAAIDAGISAGRINKSLRGDIRIGLRAVAPIRAGGVAVTLDIPLSAP